MTSGDRAIYGNFIAIALSQRRIGWQDRTRSCTYMKFADRKTRIGAFLGADDLRWFHLTMAPGVWQIPVQELEKPAQIHVENPVQ